MLRPLSVLCGIELRPHNLGGESLEVCIDDERSRQLLEVALEGELVLTLLRHLHSDCGLPNPSTVGSVGFQKILPCVAVQAALAEVLAPLVLALIVEAGVDVLDPGVVKFAGLFNQQYVVPSNILKLIANMVDFYAPVPAKYIDDFIKQVFEFGI